MYKTKKVEKYQKTYVVGKAYFRAANTASRLVTTDTVRRCIERVRRRHCMNDMLRTSANDEHRLGAARRRGNEGVARRDENSRNGGEPNIGKCRRATGHVRTVDERDRGGDHADERTRGASRCGYNKRHCSAGRIGCFRSRCAGFFACGFYHRRS